MAIGTIFYGSKSDVNLGKDAMLESGDLFVRKFHYVGTATMGTPGATATLTISTVFETDFFNSVAANCYIVDDNGVVCAVAVDDTSVTSTTTVVTVDTTSAYLESDGTTPGSFTGSATYNIYLKTPTAASDEFSGLYGKYLGYVTAFSLENTENYANVKINIPKKKVLEGLVEREMALTGEIKTMTGVDTLDAILTSASYGDTTGNVYSRGIGSNPGARPYYELTFVSNDSNNRRVVWRFLKGQFSANGAIDLLAEDYKMIPFSFSLFADGFYPVTADYAKMWKVS
jgi:hypothetical protein